MKYNNKTFQLKYEAWKNGADYWKDIRGINLGGKAQEDEPSEEEQLQIRALVNSILDAYNSGKDDAYILDIAKDLRPIPFDAPLNHELPKFGGGKPDFYELAADYIIQHEGFLPNATDIGDGVITIGYGTTDPRYAKLGRTISRDAARKLVTNDLRARYSRLSENISRYQDLPDSAKIALLSYDYNYPTSAKRTPKLYAALASGNWQEAAKLMDAGINMKKFGNGLRKRRLSEQQLFLQDLTKALRLSSLVLNMHANQDLFDNLMALKVTAPPQAATLPTPATRVLTNDTDSQQYNSMAADARNLILEPTPLPNAIQNMLQGNNKGKDAYGQKFWLRRGKNLHFDDGKDPYLYPPTDYDFVQARDLNYRPGDDGHWPSRNYKTGRYLKSPTHPTLYKGIIADNSLGYYPYYQDGAIYTNTWRGNEPYTGMLENYILYRSKKKGAKK